MKAVGIFLLLFLAICFYQGECNILLRSWFLSSLKPPRLPRGEAGLGRGQLLLGLCSRPGQGTGVLSGHAAMANGHQTGGLQASLMERL